MFGAILKSVIFLLCPFAFSAEFAAAVPLSSVVQERFIGDDLQILKSQRKLDIQEVLKVDRSSFLELKQEVPRFGYSRDDFWARLDIDSNENQSTRIFFEFRGPIELVKAYLIVDGRVSQVAEAGMYLFPEEESFVSGHCHPVVALDIPKGASTIFFSEEAVAPHFPIVAYSEEGFKKRLVSTSAILNSLLGVLGAFLVIMLVIIIFVNKLSALLLVIAFVSFVGLIGFVAGIFRVAYFEFGMLQTNVLAGYLKLYHHWPLFLGVYFLSLSLYSISQFGKDLFWRNTLAKTLDDHFSRPAGFYGFSSFVRYGPGNEFVFSWFSYYYCPNSVGIDAVVPIWKKRSILYSARLDHLWAIHEYAAFLFFGHHRSYFLCNLGDYSWIFLPFILALVFVGRRNARKLEGISLRESASLCEA